MKLRETATLEEKKRPKQKNAPGSSKAERKLGAERERKENKSVAVGFCRPREKARNRWIRVLVGLGTHGIGASHNH